jgi:spore maturation protein CgeB
MRIQLVTTDYPDFQTAFYHRAPELASASYSVQIAAREKSHFGIVGGYAHYLRQMGHEVAVVIANCEPIQRAWAREQGIRFSEAGARHLVMRGGVIPWVAQSATPRWRHDIVMAQVRAFRPDVLMNQALVSVPSSLVASMRQYAGLTVGLHGARIPEGFDVSPYDILFSGHAGLAASFAELGAKRVEVLPHAFDARVLNDISLRRPTIPVTFVGSVGAIWPDRMMWLSALCRRHPVSIFGPTRLASEAGEDPAVRKAYQCERWGDDMFQVMRDSSIGLNIHAAFAGQIANNMRLFEITGVGSLLVTDFKPNLSDWFDMNREVVAYCSIDDCVEQVGYYLAHEDERAAIAEAGQRRTLRSHTLEKRIEQFASIVLTA